MRYINLRLTLTLTLTLLVAFCPVAFCPGLVADPIKHISRHMCNHAEFGRIASKGV